MKKKLVISILIIGIVLISGCTSEEKINSETSTDSQINHESDTKNPNLIIKQNDVLRLKLGDYKFLAIPKSSYYIINSKENIMETPYQDVLPLGKRKVGETSNWGDKSGRTVVIMIKNYDSNSGLKEKIIVFNETIRKENSEVLLQYDDYGNPKIGESCSYVVVSDNQNDISRTVLEFIYKNNLVYVIVLDEKAKSKNEAIRIAKIIESRLD